MSYAQVGPGRLQYKCQVVRVPRLSRLEFQKIVVCLETVLGEMLRAW